MVTLPAHLVATPVLERLAAGHRRAGPEGRDGGLEGELRGAGPHEPTGELEGMVLGAGATAAWVDLDGFVIAITTREVPLLPNAIALAAGSGALARAGAGSGATARLTPGRVTLGPLQVTWDPAAPPSWDPKVPVPAVATRQAVSARGAALLRALGAEGVGTTREPVDNDENRIPRSATLPHRGPEQPAGAKTPHGRPVSGSGRSPGSGPGSTDRTGSTPGSGPGSGPLVDPWFGNWGGSGWPPRPTRRGRPG